MRVQQEYIVQEREELKRLNEMLAQSENEKIQMKKEIEREKEEVRLQKEKYEFEK